jgi:hypothetical protein
VLARDNTVAHGGLRLPESRLRAHDVKANVKVRHYPDGTLAVFHGPRRLACYAVPQLVERGRPVEDAEDGLVRPR